MSNEIIEIMDHTKIKMEYFIVIELLSIILLSCIVRIHTSVVNMLFEIIRERERERERERMERERSNVRTI